MAWTTEEAASIRAAVLALATGTRVATVSYAGPPARSVQYGVADLDALRKLLAQAEASATAAPTFRRAAFSKGFDPPRGE